MMYETIISLFNVENLWHHFLKNFIKQSTPLRCAHYYIIFTSSIVIHVTLFIQRLFPLHSLSAQEAADALCHCPGAAGEHVERGIGRTALRRRCLEVTGLKYEVKRTDDVKAEGCVLCIEQ